MNISTHQLDAMICIVQCGSFSKAAEQLFITPSALIQKMNALERQVGFKIFTRDHSGVSLTVCGARFYQHVCAMLSSLNDCILICQQKERNQDTVRFAFDMQKNQLSFYYPYLEQLQAAFPQLRISYLNLDSGRVFEDYAQNQFDFCALAIDSVLSKKYPFIFFKRSRLVVMMSANHHLASKALITPEDLTNETVAIHDLPHRPSASAWCAQNPNCHLISMTSHHAQIIQHCMQNGLFLFPESNADKLPPLISKPLNVPLTIDHGLIYQKQPNLTPYVKLLKSLNSQPSTA